MLQHKGTIFPGHAVSRSQSIFLYFIYKFIFDRYGLYVKGHGTSPLCFTVTSPPISSLTSGSGTVLRRNGPFSFPAAATLTDCEMIKVHDDIEGHRRKKKKANERNEGIERGKEQRIRMEHEAATWLYRWEVTSSQHYTTHDEGVRKSRLGRAKRAPTPFFSIFSHSLSFRRRIRRPLLDSSSAILIVIPRLSPIRVERKKSWMSSFDFFDFQRMTHRSSWPESLLFPAVRITTRNYLTRITLQTPGGDWRSTGGLRVKRMMVYLRPLQVCRHLRVPSSPSHGLRSVLSQLLMVVLFFFPVLGC